MDNDAPEGTCYICGHGNPDVIQEHHIIPRRYDGSDAGRNLVNLCPSCHDSVERIYDDSFFEELGLEKTSRAEHNMMCEWGECTSRDTFHIGSEHNDMFCCDQHRRCVISDCNKIGTPVTLHPDTLVILCDGHRECNHSGCYNNDVIAYDTTYAGTFVYCPEHAADDIFVSDELEIDDSKTRRDLFRDLRTTIRELQGDSSGAKTADIIDRLSETYVPPAIEEQLEELRSVGKIYTVRYGPEEVRLV